MREGIVQLPFAIKTKLVRTRSFKNSGKFAFSASVTEKPFIRRFKVAICSLVTIVSPRYFNKHFYYQSGGAVASWFVHSSLDRTVWVQALARDIMLYC